MQHLSDTEIWDKLRHGDKLALKYIYDTHYSYLYNYGRKIFQDIQLVEDSIHDLFVELWERRERLGQTDSIPKYIATSLRRKVIAALKKQKKVQHTDDPGSLDFSAELAIEEILINQEMSQERAEKLKAAFEKLSGRQKEVLYLRFYKGLDYEQIAEVVGIRYQSLRNLISGGLKKLRSELIILLLLAVILEYLMIK